MNRILLFIVLTMSALAGNAQTVTTWSGDKTTAGNTSGQTIANTKWSQPHSMCFDPNGNMYVSDADNHCIKVIPAGQNVVYTRVGSMFAPGTTGAWGYTNAYGTSSLFHSPKGLVSDASGNVYVCDAMNNAIRKIAPYVNVGSTQQVSTFVGAPEGSNPPAGTTDGTGTAARFDGPYGICTDGTNLYVTDENNNSIRKIVISSGAVTTLTGSASGSAGGMVNGTLAQAKFKYPRGIAFSSVDNALYVCDYGNSLIRRILLGSGTVETFAGGGGVFAGDDGARLSCSVKSPDGIMVDPFGHLFFVASNNAHTLRRWNKTVNYVNTLCGKHQVSGNTDAAGQSARFNTPTGVIMTSDKKTLYICDNLNGIIRAVDLQPVADFYATTTVLSTGATTILRDTSLSMITNWTWTITPGTLNTDYQFVAGTNANSQYPEVKFNTAGTYTVKLDVVNPYGTSTKTRTTYITVNNSSGQPVADFIADKTTGDINTIFNFSNLTTNNASCTYQWSFAPSNISYLNSTNQNSANPSVRFTTKAVYSVTLAVTHPTFSVAPKVRTNYINVTNVGIDGTDASFAFGVFPNPNHGTFTLVSFDALNNATAQVTDLQGKQIALISLANTREQEIRIPDAARGVYFVKVITEGKVATQKIVVE